MAVGIIDSDPGYACQQAIGKYGAPSILYMHSMCINDLRLTAPFDYRTTANNSVVSHYCGIEIYVSDFEPKDDMTMERIVVRSLYPVTVPRPAPGALGNALCSIYASKRDQHEQTPLGAGPVAMSLGGPPPASMSGAVKLTPGTNPIYVYTEGITLTSFDLGNTPAEPRCGCGTKSCPTGGICADYCDLAGTHWPGH